MTTTTIPAPPSDKQTVLDLLERLPETATLAEIAEQVSILAGIERGQKDIDEGRFVSQDEARRSIKRGA